MYDLFIFFGHGEGDNGACANGYTELEKVRLLTSRIVKLLSDKEVSVLSNVANGYNNYNRNLTNGQHINYKMGCSIHLNSASDKSANGSEIIVPLKEKYLNIEEYILNEYKKIGFNIRGIKSRNYDTEKFEFRNNGTKSIGIDYYKEIRQAWGNGNSLSIIETCFISNKKDIDLFDKNFDKIAKIIANAYLIELGKETYKLFEDSQTSINKIYKVQLGAFKEINNAKKLQNELKSKGYDSVIV